MEQSLAQFCLDGAIFHGENKAGVKPLVIGFDTRSVPSELVNHSITNLSWQYLA